MSTTTAPSFIWRTSPRRTSRRGRAHRREEREAPVLALDRLVGDPDDARPSERARERGRRRQVQVCEEELAGSEPRVLRLERLLDLEDQLGAHPHVLDARELGADRGILLVADAAAAAGGALDHHPVA